MKGASYKKRIDELEKEVIHLKWAVFHLLKNVGVQDFSVPLIDVTDDDEEEIPHEMKIGFRYGQSKYRQNRKKSKLKD